VMFELDRKRIEAAVLYGAIFIAAVFWFEFQSAGFDAAKASMEPYFPVFYVIVIAAGAGMSGYLSDLFLRDPSRWVTLASIALPPFVVLLSSCLIASLALMVAMHIMTLPLNDVQDTWGVISATINALSVGFYF